MKELKQINLIKLFANATYMKSKISTAIKVKDSFRTKSNNVSINSATNLFHKGGILYVIPEILTYLIIILFQ